MSRHHHTLLFALLVLCVVACARDDALPESSAADAGSVEPDVPEDNNTLPQDNEAPAVRFIAPERTSVTPGVVELEVTAADNEAVTDVTFLLDGEEVGSLVRAPWRWLWDTRELAPGSFRWTVVARDAQRNQGRDEIRLVLMAAEPEEPEEPEEPDPPEAPEFTLDAPAMRITSISFVDTDHEGFDLDGDGSTGNVLPSLDQLLGGQLVNSVQQSLDTNTLSMGWVLSGLSSPDTRDQEDVWLDEVLLRRTQGELVLRRESLNSDSQPQVRRYVRLEDGMLAGRGGASQRSAFIGDFLQSVFSRGPFPPHAVQVSAWQIDAEIVVGDGESRLEGAFGFALPYLELVRLLNELAQSPECSCLGGQGLLVDPDNVQCLDAYTSDDCVDEQEDACVALVTVCGYMSLLGSILDLDVDGDGQNDSMSMVFSFSAQEESVSRLDSNPP